MQTIPPLATLGHRIMILGLTNAGKSTLALALSDKLGVPAIHLDQLKHLPNTNWQERSDADFQALHDAAITGDGWVMDGNYTRLMPQRIERATGIIVVTDTLFTRYRRYFIRTLIQRQRAGGLEGGEDRVNWKMLHWLWHTRNSVAKYRDMATGSAKPTVFASSTRELNALYDTWSLKHPFA